MLGILFLLLLLIPIAELWVIVQVAQGIGIPETLLLLVVMSVAGAWLLKQQGRAAWLRLQEATARGEVPHKEVTDGVLIVIGGALLLTPGFLTDAVGLLLLLPPTRVAIKGVATRVLGGWIVNRAGTAGRAGVYTARVVRAKRRSSEEATPPAREPEALSDDVDDSRDRG